MNPLAAQAHLDSTPFLGQSAISSLDQLIGIKDILIVSGIKAASEIEAPF